MAVEDTIVNNRYEVRRYAVVTTGIVTALCATLASITLWWGGPSFAEQCVEAGGNYSSTNNTVHNDNGDRDYVDEETCTMPNVEE